MSQPRLPNFLDFLLEEVACFSTVAELLELLQVEETALIFVDYIEELFDICEGYLDAMLLEHLLELFRIKRT